MIDDEAAKVIKDLGAALADHVEDDLREHAEKAVDELPEGCCRTAVVLLLMQEARQVWRSRTLQRERAAEVTPEPTTTTPPAAKPDGHTGRFPPGSWSKKNRCTCEACEAGQREASEFEVEWAERKDRRMQVLLDEFARDLKMEWTTELLTSGFALPDGTLVTWGEATIEQHVVRADMLRGNAIANAEAAARHLHAIETIKGAGAATLGEAVRRAVPDA